VIDASSTEYGTDWLEESPCPASVVFMFLFALLRNKNANLSPNNFSANETLKLSRLQLSLSAILRIKLLARKELNLLI
jgi:hypothetical protein